MPDARRCAPVDRGHVPGKRPLRDVRDVVDLILDDEFRRTVVAAARSLGLPDGAIGAGFLRAPVWDFLHGYPTTWFADIDLLYFDASDQSVATELRLEGDLARLMPGVPWQVRNQARMHMRNGDEPYCDTADAIGHWLETPTAVALPLARGGESLMAPFGIDDLLNLCVRPTPAGVRRGEAYRARLREKRWHRRWPMVRIFDIDGSEIDTMTLEASPQ
jgi:hypothetical protein